MQALCPKCEKTVAAFPLFPETEFWTAITLGKPVEVMHTSDDCDRTWILNEQEIENLRKQKAKGMIKRL